MSNTATIGPLPKPAHIATVASLGGSDMEHALVSLAAQMGIDPLAAVALPAVIDSASRKAGMTEAAMVAECRVNEPLREYLAQICRDADVKAALS